jgi:hypothetical protein
MPIVSLLIVLVLLAVVLYVVQLLPLEPGIKRILQIVIGLIVVLWLLGAMDVVSLGNLRAR